MADEIIPSRRWLNNFTNKQGDAQNLLVVFTLTDMAMSAAAGMYTSTSSMAGATPENVTYLVQLLTRGGYTTSYTSNILTVSWD